MYFYEFLFLSVMKNRFCNRVNVPIDESWTRRLSLCVVTCVFRDSSSVRGQDSCSAVSTCRVEEIQWTPHGQCVPVLLFLQVSWAPFMWFLYLLDQWKEGKGGCWTRVSRQQSDWGRIGAIDAQPSIRAGGGARGRRCCTYNRRIFFTKELWLSLVVLFLLGHAVAAQKTPRSGWHWLAGLHGYFGAWSHLPATSWPPAGHTQWLGRAQCSGFFKNYSAYLLRYFFKKPPKMLCNSFNVSRFNV